MRKCSCITVENWKYVTSDTKLLIIAVCVQENDFIEQISSNIDVEELESNKIQRFELLRNELIELEKRVQRSADQSENEEVYPELYALLDTIFLRTGNLVCIDAQLFGTVI